MQWGHSVADWWLYLYIRYSRYSYTDIVAGQAWQVGAFFLLKKSNKSPPWQTDCGSFRRRHRIPWEYDGNKCPSLRDNFRSIWWCFLLNLNHRNIKFYFYFYGFFSSNFIAIWIRRKVWLKIWLARGQNKAHHWALAGEGRDLSERMMNDGHGCLVISLSLSTNINTSP